MPQIGVLASMGIYAIDHANETIMKDHKNMAVIVNGKAKYSWFEIFKRKKTFNITYY